MSLVIDGSVALAWCLDDETSGYADFALTLLGSTEAVVPSHWQLEVVNGLIAAERRGKIAPGDTDRLLSLLAHLPITSEPVARGEILRMTHRLAQSHGLSAYEAAYLELALRRGFQLVSMEESLSTAARSEGVGG